MAGEFEVSEVGRGNFDARGVGFLEMSRGDGEAGFCGGSADEGQQDQEGAQNVASPGRGDLAEKFVLNGIPFRTAWRIVQDGDFQAGFVGEFLQALLVATRPRPVAAAGIGFDQQTLRVGIVPLVASHPIAGRIHREIRRIAGSGHAHMTGVAFGVVDAVRRSLGFGVAGKIVIVDLFPFPTPRLASVLELADEFLLLGVHADPRVTRPSKIFTLSLDVLELFVAFRMLFTGVKHFAMTSQPQFLLA